METTTKICTKCKTEKSITEFNKSSRNLDGHYSSCKQCQKDFRESNKDKINQQRAKFRIDNKEKLKIQSKNNYQKYKEKIDIANKEWAIKNKEKVELYRKQYYIDNKEKINIKHKKYYEENKDSFALNQKKYYIENKERLVIRDKEYRERNKGRIKEYVKKYRQTKECKISKRTSNHLRNCKIRIENDKTINKKSLRELLNKQDGKCYYCKCELDFNIKFSVHLDHYTPIAKGGIHSINNVVWSCKSCNLSKQGKMPSEPLKL